jgi:hypothetical protein
VPIPTLTFHLLEKDYNPTNLYDTFFLILSFSFESVEITVMENLVGGYVAEAPKRGGPANQRYYGSQFGF